MKKIFTTTLLVSCFLICLAAIADLNGKWSGKLVTSDGQEYPLLYNFKVDGDKLTGTALTPEGDVDIKEGKTNGTDFSFTVATSGIVIPHTGKFMGDSISVELDINGSKSSSVLKRPVEKK
ncbi:glycoside hydrolase [Mucilaginibacter rubeus]|uniref:Glycoside hydrolase n=1 Tax=Mucilaginibacter rubeus TaxID=2027860 RepID=A0A5C1I2L1_9SPHI|nr:glycoside hydrolase [Mucilaginibacter rubeus]QEM11560.1 glycoside hydrolase [Mucilaginibacter rubeus]